MPTANELRADAVRKADIGVELARVIPNGSARSQPFPCELRASTIIWQESERHKLEGYASVVDKRYDMYDMFGEYKEIVAAGAFDKTLSKHPDVAFLVNHRGMTMARTSNGSLELEADSKGLKSTAYLNPKRSDVQDLIVAIDDKDVTEMSFAFLINDGQWNDDYTEYTISEVDLDRGDVSAVNYGANPYTSVSARQLEVIRDFQRLPAGAQRAAMSGLDRDSTRDQTRTAALDPAYLVDVMQYLIVNEPVG